MANWKTFGLRAEPPNYESLLATSMSRTRQHRNGEERVILTGGNNPVLLTGKIIQARACRPNRYDGSARSGISRGIQTSILIQRNRGPPRHRRSVLEDFRFRRDHRKRRAGQGSIRRNNLKA